MKPCKTCIHQVDGVCVKRIIKIVVRCWAYKYDPGDDEEPQELEF